MVNNLNFIGLVMGRMAARFDFENLRVLEDTGIESPLTIDYNTIMNSRDIRNESVSLMTDMIKSITKEKSTHENTIMINQVTIIGIGMIGSVLATLISNKYNNHIIFVDENNTDELQFYRGENCIFIKDRIVNGTKTLEIIDKAQRLGHKPLAIISIMNENLPLTKDKFEGKSNVDKKKLQVACPMYAILTPQSIYKQLVCCKDEDTATMYQKTMCFSIEDIETKK